MTENFEFSTSAKVRKSLLIFSLIGIFLKETQKYNTGRIAFLGFEVPVENFGVVLKFFIWIIIFYLIAFSLRIYSEWASNKIVRLNDKLQDIKSSVHTMEEMIKHIEQSRKENAVAVEMKEVSKKIKKTHWILLVIKNFLDFVFPIGFGIFALIWIIEPKIL
jgi:uncharacterized protein YeeX (DUF496 family)